jgi:hypothetical protein
MNDLDTADGDNEMAARVSSWAGVQDAGPPEAVDLSRVKTKRMYGLDRSMADFRTGACWRVVW